MPRNPNVWLINPEDAQENPRRRRRGRRGAKRAHVKRRRRRAARSHHNPGRPFQRMKRHRRARRNPAGTSFFGIDVGKAGIGVLGAVGSDLAGEWVHGMLPKTMDPKVLSALKYPIKAGVVVTTSLLLGKFFGRAAGAAAGIGGAILLGVDAAREFVLPNVPLLHGGLSGMGLGWEDLPSMNGYVRGMEGYVDQGGSSTASLNGFGRQWGA